MTPQLTYIIIKRHDNQEFLACILSTTWQILIFGGRILKYIFGFGCLLLVLVNVFFKNTQPQEPYMAIIFNATWCMFLAMVALSIFSGISVVHEGKKAYRPYRKTYGHPPVYLEHRAIIKTNVEREQMFWLCLKSIRHIASIDYHFVDSDPITGVIKARITHKQAHGDAHNYGMKKELKYINEIVEFNIEPSTDHHVVIHITAYRDFLIRTLNTPQNIIDLEGIYAYLQQELAAQGVETSITVASTST